MTKLLSAKELLEVVRTAQADAQATGGGAKWPPRMAVGGRSGPRRRAIERARERDAQNVGPPPADEGQRPFNRQRGGTVPVMNAVSAPPPASAPLPAPPSPGPPARYNTVPTGTAVPVAAVEAQPSPAMQPTGDLPPASAILAAMRAGRGNLPPPREPEPIPPSNERIEPPPRPPSMPHLAAVQPEPKRRAPTNPEPISVRSPPAETDEGQPSAARSLAALFPPARPPMPSSPDGPSSSPAPISSPGLAVSPPTQPLRGALPTMPEAPMARGKSSPPGKPLAREEPEEAPPSSTVPLELPDLAVEVKSAGADKPLPPDGPKRDKTSPATAFAALGRLSGPPAARESVPPVDPRTSSPSTPPAQAAAATPAPMNQAAVARAAAARAAAAAESPRVDVSWATQKPAWAPESVPLDQPADVDEGPAPVALSTDETIVLLNYDAQASLQSISAMTGFSVFKVERIVERLMDQGVLEDLPSSPEAPKAKLKHAPQEAKPVAETVAQALAGDSSPESLEGPPTEVDPRKEDEEAEGESAEKDEDEREQDKEEDEPESQREEEPSDAQKDAELEANYRKLYETKLARLEPDQRMKLAELGSGADLYALSFDKDPQIARALFDNQHFNVDHARFAAFYHPTSFGLDRLATRNEFMKDPQVQRKLMRNPHTPELVVRRVLSPKRLLEVYKVTNDRDVPDRQRMVARGTLRQKFTTADPEDRLQLLWNTEGRCLTLLSGCAIDSKTTALFCARPVVSLLMVQNFAKFGATPPGLLNHFLKQNLVRRQVPLRNMLLKHPNCPSEAKKGY